MTRTKEELERAERDDKRGLLDTIAIALHAKQISKEDLLTLIKEYEDRQQ